MPDDYTIRYRDDTWRIEEAAVMAVEKPPTFHLYRNGHWIATCPSEDTARWIMTALVYHAMAPSSEGTVALE